MSDAVFANGVEPEDFSVEPSGLSLVLGRAVDDGLENPRELHGLMLAGQGSCVTIT